MPASWLDTWVKAARCFERSSAGRGALLMPPPPSRARSQLLAVEARHRAAPLDSHALHPLGGTSRKRGAAGVLTRYSRSYSSTGIRIPRDEPITPRSGKTVRKTSSLKQSR
jgi:hypothetical protein